MVHKPKVKIESCASRVGPDEADVKNVKEPEEDHVMLKGSPNERMRKRVPAKIILQRFALGSAVLCCVINCIVLFISATAGRWVFGDVCCQLFGWCSQVLSASSTWMVALFTLERCCYYMMPTEYVSILSEINTRLLVYGVDLLLVVMHTAPLYGWGEYSQYRGGLPFDMVPATDVPSSTAATASTSPVNISDTTSHSLFTNNLTLLGGSANDVDLTVKGPDLYFTSIQLLNKLLEAQYSCNIRLNVVPVFQTFIRCPSIGVFDSFVLDYNSGHLVDMLTSEAVESSTEGVLSHTRDYLVPVIKACDVGTYRDTYLTIQDLGMCTLDWSSMNQATSSWIPIVILTSTVIPFSVAIVCAAILLRSSRFRESRAYLLPTCSCCLTGAIVGLLSASFYYAAGVLLYNSIIIDRTFYAIGSVLYYFSSLWFSVLMLLSGWLCTAK